MYKCYCCGALFYETGTKEVDADYVPAPFGIGTVRMGGGLESCCPECESDDYSKLYFDGIHCPYCHEVIDRKTIEKIEDDENCEFRCQSCKTEFYLKNGEIEDAYRK